MFIILQLLISPSMVQKKITQNSQNKLHYDSWNKVDKIFKVGKNKRISVIGFEPNIDRILR